MLEPLSLLLNSFGKSNQRLYYCLTCVYKERVQGYILYIGKKPRKKGSPKRETLPRANWVQVNKYII